MTDKVGLDDFLAAGGDPAALMAAASDEVAIETPAYFERHGCTYWNKPTRDDLVPTKLANFIARIITDVTRDDGLEGSKMLEIEGVLEGETKRFAVSASQFGSMGWVLEHLGAGAIVSPSQGMRDHLRAAIQTLSAGSITKRTVYTHTGWRKVNDEWVYLHADGAIGPIGPVSGVEVDLPRELSHFKLPEPLAGPELVAAIQASLGLLALTGNNADGDRVMVPLLGTVYRSVLGPWDASIHLFGDTGARKTELAARAQQHFGPGFIRTNLPSWVSTANYNEALAFHAKDAALVIDDFVPQGTAMDRARLEQQADRIFRGVGNGAGRGRLRPDGTPRPARAPRAVIMSTGEEVPGGRSRQARMLLVEVPAQPKNQAPTPGAVRLDVLTRCQDQGERGLYAQAMAGYLRSLARRHPEAMAEVKSLFKEFRARALGVGSHSRDPEKVANVAVGWEMFLRFALEVGAITAQQGEGLRRRVWTALVGLAEEQAVHEAEANPALRFVELVRSALAAQQAHLVDRGSDRAPPGHEARCGWRRRSGGPAGTEEWISNAVGIGWIDGEDIYLNPDAALKAAQSMAGGIALLPPTKALGRHLRSDKLLKSVDSTRGRNVIRITSSGARHEVWHFAADSLLPSEHRPNRPNGPIASDRAHSSARSEEAEWADRPDENDPAVHESAQAQDAGRRENLDGSVSGADGADWDDESSRGQRPLANSRASEPVLENWAAIAPAEEQFSQAKRQGLPERDLRVHRMMLARLGASDHAIREIERRIDEALAAERGGATP